MNVMDNTGESRATVLAVTPIDLSKVRESTARGVGTPATGIADEGDPAYTLGVQTAVQAVAVTPINADALRGEGAAATPSPDAEGRVRLRDPGLGIGDEGDPAGTLAAAGPGAVAIYQDSEYGVGEYDTAGTLRAVRIPEHQMVVSATGDKVHALTSEGHDASEDGTGRGTPIISVSNDNAPQVYEDAVGALKIGTGLDIPSAPAVLAPTLSASNDPSRSPQSSEVTAQVEAMQQATSQVRRLTPRECERLQGFPDDWTAGQADSARYRQMGNAVAVPVVEWIMRRLAEMEADTDA